ncbi:clathrin-dependent endocytosis protein [Malassezia pachydermatis]|uniref:Fog: tpr repeat n=1 Tax=Malassezia pachydermatis TaxID=77020 RepID=A0A0M9VP29_9BASI|nr:fog: tpr repeat [Malassezia pachydermatis]KOS13805.1 fog: tpr repeat [Malassezia pachydermatis]
MEDLADLDWGSASSKARSSTPSSTYNFDALLRSMPSSGSTATTARPPPRPAVTATAPAAKAATTTKREEEEDAFASLLPTFGQKPVSGPPSSRPLASSSKAPTSSTDPWGFDAFESISAAPKREIAPHTQRTTTHDDLLADFHGPQPSASMWDGEETSDLLSGMAPAPPSSSAPRASAPRSTPASRGNSPPPHIIGQLVEMGYAPQQAREALAQTANGQDVAQALASLQASMPAPPREPLYETLPAPARPSTHASTTEGPSASWQKQADQLYSQASVFGTQMLKNANALWGNAKAQAQKAMEEARKESTDPSAIGVATELGRHALRRWGGQPKKPVDFNAKPRWMAEAERSSSSPPASETQGTSSQPAKTAPRDVSLLSDDGPPMRPAATPLRRPPTKPSKAVPTAQPVVRTLSPDDAGVVTHAARLKDQGNAHFQRGSYAEAEEHYTKALDMLPARSLWRIPLFNNRANVRMKNGNSDGAIVDCTAVIELTVLPHMADGMYRPSQDALPSSHSSINLREAYAKSLSRRARAHEVSEKWALAKKDWDLLQQYERLEGSGVKSGETHRRAAMEGVARCERMLIPRPASAPAAASKSRAVSSRAAQKASQEGRERMRAIHAAQQAEEAQRMTHKDSVDERIAAWTKGKESNVRALLASVDDPRFDLLWPELRWKKIGMHELVTDAQVKRAYTRAIARLHPDKLPPQTTSVEQRMLAAGVFHALNDAFNGS